MSKDKTFSSDLPIASNHRFLVTGSLGNLLNFKNDLPLLNRQRSEVLQSGTPHQFGIVPNCGLMFVKLDVIVTTQNR